TGTPAAGDEASMAGAVDESAAASAGEAATEGDAAEASDEAATEGENAAASADEAAMEGEDAAASGESAGQQASQQQGEQDVTSLIIASGEPMEAGEPAPYPASQLIGQQLVNAD